MRDWESERASEAEAAGGLRGQWPRTLVGVVLVIDLADQRLKDVLQRDDARGATELVDDDQHVQPLLAHELERVHGGHGLRDEGGVLHDAPHLHEREMA